MARSDTYRTPVSGTATILYTISDSSLTAQGTVTIDVVDFVPSTLSDYVFIDHVENFRDVRDKGADPIRNGIKEEDEKGFASVRIKLVSDNNYTNSPIEREVLTDSEGNFEFTNVVPGEYKVVYEHPEQVRYEGPGEYDVSIPALGDVQRSDLNFGLIGTKGAAMAVLVCLPVVTCVPMRPSPRSRMGAARVVWFVLMRRASRVS